MKKLLACVLVAAGTGCPSIDVDTDEGPSDAPIVEFDPGNRIVPFPNNLLLNPQTGLVNLPASCGETETAKALRENVLNKLDGFGTFETTMTVTFSEPVDPATLEGNVVILQRIDNGAPAADPMPLPYITRVGTTARFDAMCANPQMVDQVAIIPIVPLEQKSTYTVALKQGIKTASGADFTASFTWSLIRQPENPVTLDDNGVVTSDRTPLDPANPDDYETLVGVDLLWRAHAQGMAHLKANGLAHTDVLLAWEFNTQTTTDPLDKTVTGSPASMIPEATVLAGLQSLVPQGATAEDFMRQVPALAGRCRADNGPLPCEAVSDILVGGLPSRQYQVERPNPFTAPVCGPMGDQPCGPIPGPWGDPRTPEFVKVEPIRTFAFVPQAQVCPNADTAGCPTIIFQHGLGRSQSDVFAIASQLNAVGYNVVAIDAVAHGSRAVRISNDAARGCDGVRTATTAPQCFASFLSPDLATTRDNIRQTILDHLGLVQALKSCGTESCGALNVDATKIQYIGQSLGGIMGSITAAMSDDIKASVLNVPGVGWVDILENTQTLAIRCTLVDGLIAAGILTGDPWNPMAGTGLCTTDDWKTQPGYRQFSVIGRWILDPADPANFTQRLAARRFLLQEVVDDQVVPNIATENEAKLTGVFATAMDADASVPSGNPPPAPPVNPSPAVATMPMESKLVRYKTLPPAAPSFPGNTYGHGSLLAPASNDAAGSLATAKMQVDAIYYLIQNK